MTQNIVEGDEMHNKQLDGGLLKELYDQIDKLSVL